MQASIDTSLPPARPSAVSRVRRRLLLGLVLIALVAVAWSALWHVAADKVDATIAAVIAREAAAGRDLSCASREISGFPFAISVTCEKPKLEISRPTGKLVLTGQRLTGSSGIEALGRATLTAEGPVSIEAPGISDAQAQWRSLVATVVLGFHGFDHADLVVDTPSLRFSAGEKTVSANADRAELDVRPDRARPSEDDAMAIKGKLVHLASPLLDTLAADQSPADAELDASVSRASAFRPASAGPHELALERWRSAGGIAHIAKADFTKGPISIAVAGDIGLDDAHRLKGRVDAAIEGVDTLVRHLQIPKIATNVLKMSGGKLRLPAELADGRVSAMFGPVAISLPVVLTPLY